MYISFVFYVVFCRPLSLCVVLFVLLSVLRFTAWLWSTNFSCSEIFHLHFYFALLEERKSSTRFYYHYSICSFSGRPSRRRENKSYVIPGVPCNCARNITNERTLDTIQDKIIVCPTLTDKCKSLNNMERSVTLFHCGFVIFERGGRTCSTKIC